MTTIRFYFATAIFVVLALIYLNARAVTVKVIPGKTIHEGVYINSMKDNGNDTATLSIDVCGTNLLLTVTRKEVEENSKDIQQVLMSAVDKFCPKKK